MALDAKAHAAGFVRTMLRAAAAASPLKTSDAAEALQSAFSAASARGPFARQCRDNHRAWGGFDGQ
jgi:hypothetical protein